MKSTTQNTDAQNAHVLGDISLPSFEKEESMKASHTKANNPSMRKLSISIMSERHIVSSSNTTKMNGCVMRYDERRQGKRNRQHKHRKTAK
jgi:hypothetical protein